MQGRIGQAKAPISLALVPDGQQRGARELGADVWLTNELGADLFHLFAIFSRLAGIEHLVVYASTQELASERGCEGLQPIHRAAAWLLILILLRLRWKGIGVTVVGDVEILPWSLEKLVFLFFKHYCCRSRRTKMMIYVVVMGKTGEALNCELETAGLPNGRVDLRIDTGTEIGRRLHDFVEATNYFSTKTLWPLVSPKQLLDEALIVWHSVD